MKKTRKSILVWLLALVMTALLVSTGITAFAVEGDTEEPPATMPEEVQITKVETIADTVVTPPAEEGGEETSKTTYYLQVTFNMPDGEFTGTQPTTAQLLAHLYYNYEHAKNKIGTNNRFNGVTMLSTNVLKFKFNVQPDPELDDVVTFVKGWHISLNEDSTVLADTTKWKYTEDGWVNLTAQQKETEQKLRFELQNDCKNSASVVGGNFGLEFVKFVDIATGAVLNIDYNDEQWGNHVEIGEYIKFKGADGSTAINGWWIRYASAVRLGTDGSHTFAKGDEITFLKGLHFCRHGGNWGGTPVYASSLTYNGYLDETITFRCTGSGWIVKTTVAEAMGVDSVKAIEEKDATMSLPATYEFTVKFNNIVTDGELDGLEAEDAYAEHILIGGKTVKALNEEITELVNDDDEPVKAVYLSAADTEITVTVVKASNIWDGASTLNLQVTSGLTADSENFTNADATYHYVADIDYWSTVEPYEVEQKNAIDIASVADFVFVDNGANGDITVTFTEKLADGATLWYNCLPDYRKGLSAPFDPTHTDNLVSADAYFSFLDKVIIDGQSLSELYAGGGSAESKSSTYQCHIGANGDAKSIAFRAAKSTWSGTEAITIVFKSGLKFASGNYLDHDVTIKYTPGEPATTVYEVAATSVALVVTGAEATEANKYEIEVDDTLNLSATLAPATANNAEVAYVVGDGNVVKVEGGVLTALKAGTTTVKATYGTLESATVTVTVKAKTVAATSVTLTVTGATATSANKYEIKVGGTLNVSAAVVPAGATGSELKYVIGDNTIVKIEGGVLTALKAGTTTVKATYGTLESVTVTVTVKAEGGTTPGTDPGKKPEPEKKPCGSNLGADFSLAGIVLVLAAGVFLAFSKKMKKAK